MKQVVHNLIRNAFEAMPDGRRGPGGERESWTARPAWSSGTQGPGLPEGVDVFELFFTTKAKGTGLGLPIVQQIVLQHGGDIVARARRAGARPSRSRCRCPRRRTGRER